MFRNVLQYANIVGLIWTLCVCLFNPALLPKWLINGGLIIFFVTWVVEFVWEKRWQVKPSKEWIFYGLLVVFFLWAFLYWPWEGNTYFHHHLEQRLPLLAFGIIGIFGINNRYSRSMLIHTMIIAAVSSVLFLVIKTGWHDVFVSQDRIYLVADTRIRYINSHMVYNLFLNCTLVGIWYLLFHADRQPQLWQKIVYSVAILIIFFALLCSDGRSGFFMGIVMVGCMTVIELYRYSKCLGSVVGAVIVAGILMLCSLHPRITKEKLEHNLRFSYWKAAVELIREKPVVGYGMNNAQEEFDKVNMKYASEYDKYYWTVLHHHYVDCHNQYLQTMLEYGIIGLILLLAIYLSPLWICWGSERWWLALFFTLLSMGQSLFDMFLTGQFSMLYGLMFLMTMQITRDYSFSNPTDTVSSSPLGMHRLNG